MKSATDAVRDSIANRKIPGSGDEWPEFKLVGSDGSTVQSNDLLAQGPMVISFFRGMW